LGNTTAEKSQLDNQRQERLYAGATGSRTRKPPPDTSQRNVADAGKSTDWAILTMSKTVQSKGLCAVFLLAGLSFSLRAEGASLPGTQTGRDQLADEQDAKRLIARSDIQAALPGLEKIWRSKSPGLLPETYGHTHPALEEMAFLAATQAVDSDPRRPHVVEVSAAPHRWYGIAVPGGRAGIDNPDTLYFVVPVEAASSYILTGKRGKPGPIDSNFSLMPKDLSRTITNIAQTQLRFAPDGTYTITLDGAPANGRPNHIQITADAGFLFIRNTLADWNTAHVDEFAVRRVAGPPPAPPADDDALAKKTVFLLNAFFTPWVNDYQQRIYRQPVNVIPQPGKPGDKAGFLVTQRNALGHFRLSKDEALVVTFNPAGAAYATLPISDVWGVTPAYWASQTSLNNHQAELNPDNTITAVISSWDPGVSNWVDTAGLTEGFIMMRWQGLSPNGEPSVRAKLTRRADLAASLPQRMRHVSGAERAQQSAQREAGFRRRFDTRFSDSP
jgi:hypothetical protein